MKNHLPITGTVSALLLSAGLTSQLNAVELADSITTLPSASCSLATLKGSYIWDETTRTDYAGFGFGFSEFNAGWVHAVNAGREVNDGSGNITSGHMTVNNTYTDDADLPVELGGTDGDPIVQVAYTGTVTINPDCTGTYKITLSTGGDGGGGTIYVDPLTGNFKMIDHFNIGIATFTKDGSGTAGLSSPFPVISWP